MADGITVASIVARLEADRVKPCRLPTWAEVAWLLGLVEELYAEDSGLSTWHCHPGLRDTLQARYDAAMEAATLAEEQDRERDLAEALRTTRG